jgi:quercetin dioxygenase-like cupin family protein
MMMRRYLIAAAAFGSVLGGAYIGLAQNTPAGSVVMTPDKLTWKPNARVPGVDAADLLGQADKQGAYVQRIKFPANFKVMPHTHPEERAYTIISGTWYVGWGETFDEAKLLALPPGSFYTEPANVAHFVATKGDSVVVQISGTGPTATKMLAKK